jgi:hypothetical protein
MSWATIIKIVAPIAINMMFGDKGGEGEQQQGLVPPPQYSDYFKKRQYAKEIGPFSIAKFEQQREGRPSTAIGAEPSLKAADPSTMESRYWSAIFSDAKSKSRISLE